MSELLDPFLRPRHVLVVGASRNPEAISGRPVRFLRSWGFPGEVTVVNPSGVPEIEGYPVVPTVADAPDGVDVALVLMAAGEVPRVLRECDDRGIHRAVVIASGFEGEHGRSARADLDALLAERPDLRLLGPNCVGALSVTGRATLCFSSVLLDHRPREGSLALVTQSGAIGNALLLALTRRGAGLSSWFSTGDEASIGALELATALLDDDGCSVVGMFLEGMTDIEHLPRLADAIERTGKRVVAFRTRATSDARAAAFGHTGRVIGDDEIAHAALANAGIHLVGSVDELCDALTVLSILPAAELRDRPLPVGVVTVSGGAGVIAADAIGRSPALAMARFDGPAAASVASELPPSSHVANPLDIPTLGDPKVFAEALGAVVQSGLSDAVVGVVSSLAHDYELLSTWDYDRRTPLILTHLSPEERFSPDQAARLAAKGVATVPTALGALAGLAIWVGDTGAPAVEDHVDEPAPPGAQLGLSGAVELLGPAAERVSPFVVADDAPTAVDAADRLGYPVVVKADGRVVAHRSELGAVLVGLADGPAVAEAFTLVEQRSQGDAVVVQAMAPKGIEVMVSAVRDAEVGAAVLVRPGGVLVELIQGSAVLFGDPARWPAIIRRSPLGRLLDGWRGAAPGDVDALVELAGRLLARFDLDPSLDLVECNPVIVHEPGAGLSVVDVLVRRGGGSR